MLQYELLFLYMTVGEKDAEDKDLNSEAPSLSEATSEKQANSVSQSNTVSSSKEEEQSNSIKKVRCHFESRVNSNSSGNGMDQYCSQIIEI